MPRFARYGRYLNPPLEVAGAWPDPACGVLAHDLGIGSPTGDPTSRNPEPARPAAAVRVRV